MLEHIAKAITDDVQVGLIDLENHAGTPSEPDAVAGFVAKCKQHAADLGVLREKRRATPVVIRKVTSTRPADLHSAITLVMKREGLTYDKAFKVAVSDPANADLVAKWGGRLAGSVEKRQVGRAELDCTIRSVMKRDGVDYAEAYQRIAAEQARK
jgi:hypothetical protein